MGAWAGAYLRTACHISGSQKLAHKGSAGTRRGLLPAARRLGWHRAALRLYGYKRSRLHQSQFESSALKDYSRSLLYKAHFYAHDYRTLRAGSFGSCSRRCLFLVVAPALALHVRALCGSFSTL
eukprot:6178150-Pleurochrysis_carterae.AAC.1